MADSGRLHTPQQALASLSNGLAPLSWEWVALETAGDRVLAQTLHARHDTPPFDNSAMDGYALRAEDSGRVLSVSQRIMAGQQAAPLERGTCARIFTGAPMPEGADSVIMQEEVEVRDEGVFIPAGLKVGNSVRLQGREITTDEVLVNQGTRLNSAALGFLAGQGFDRVPVYRKPRVALLFTGDELRLPGEALAPGQIYNGNRFMLMDLLPRFGAELSLVEQVPDTLEDMTQALARASRQADVIVTTGGVSVGDADYVRRALESLGELDLWRLSIRPGKPLALGHINQCRFVGLAGNPVSSFVGAWLFLRPLLGGLQGCDEMKALPAVTARAAFSTETAGRDHYMRVTLQWEGDSYRADAFEDQDSSVLRSCVAANALAVIKSHSRVAPGDSVSCLLLVS
ncbi:molybdopterin molybdenumtransferase MoeA [Kushneria pakistanensis]|uniref:Molybdopterin molybdenumtransferase n=1 Tax=Kushneria pakistanensis TaxID=1508770 RepID=A0ABQ3FDU2_9GAMM|nr:gephyrin-like molybdotransferase Glp [Kushneria pakistanensis]GHC20036.1 molybdopterin molybdenumtransferase MoeA [Kushneria pakistanensis]